MSKITSFKELKINIKNKVTYFYKLYLVRKVNFFFIIKIGGSTIIDHVYHR